MSSQLGAVALPFSMYMPSGQKQPSAQVLAAAVTACWESDAHDWSSLRQESNIKPELHITPANTDLRKLQRYGTNYKTRITTFQITT